MGEFNTGSWICPKCNRVNFGNVACEWCVVTATESISRRNRTADDPLKCRTPAPRTGFNKEEQDLGRARQMARRTTNEILSDPEFDPSINASRKRLEDALAIASEIALRNAQNGLTNADDAEFLAKIAGMYRTLVNTAMTSPSELSDEELAKRAGK